MPESKKRPKKPAISIKGETYEKLKKEAEKRGCSVSKLLEEIIEKAKT